MSSRGTALTNKEETRLSAEYHTQTKTEADLRRQVTVANPRCLVSVKAWSKSKPEHASPRLLDKGCGELKECRIGLVRKRRIAREYQHNQPPGT